jgi:hypothetical protein
MYRCFDSVLFNPVYNFVKLPTLMMDAEVDLAAGGTTVVIDYRKRGDVSVAHETESQLFDAMVDVHAPRDWIGEVVWI